MLVQTLDQPQFVWIKTPKGKFRIHIPRDVTQQFLLTLTADELAEVDRQTRIMRNRTHETLACIIRWGFTSIKNLRIR